MYNTIDIGKYVNNAGYDIFATQENFAYNADLTKWLTEYNYQTLHLGSVPVGDGTSVFTKNFKMYNEEYIVWNSLYGLADDGADQLSQKGITYVCLEIADGVYVDFYNVHADAYGDPASVAARKDNFYQLTELINSREVDRPVIVVGDINACMYPNGTDGLKEILVDKAGLQGSWVECYNNGDYVDASYFDKTLGSGWEDKYGYWDSIERVMYKDGGGISLSSDSFEYIEVLNRNGASCSDHKAADAVMSYEVTDASQISDEGLEVVQHNMFNEYIRRITKFFEILFLTISNFDTIREFLGI